MRPFRREKSLVTVNDAEGPGDRRDETLPSPAPAVSVSLVADGNAAMPAAWYPDPVDSASFRYWDGAAWTRLTKLIPPPAPLPVDEAPTALSDDAGPSLHSEVTRVEIVALEAETEGARLSEGDTPADEESADHWVKEADRAVATAVNVGTPAAWRSAAQAAVVVAEIAQTMRVTAHARQIAQQLASAAEDAATHAHSAQEAVDDAMRTASHATQAAEEAAEEARVAAAIVADARQKAEQTAQEAPKAAAAAQIAVEAAANAKAKADRLDQIVTKARESNTPEAWSEALQVAAATCGDEGRPHIVSARAIRSDPGTQT